MTSFPPEPNGPLENTETTTSEPRWLTRGDATVDAHQEHPRPTLFANFSRFRSKRPAHEKHILERFHLHRLFLVLGVLLALVALTLISTAIWLRHAMHASMAQLDGAMHAPGMSAPVTVTRDPQGVPSIQAANLDDLLFAQGFITAQDRLWQMDLVRRHAAGQLAELLGPNLVSHDRLQRTMQLAETADRAVAMLPPDQLHQLEAYARGVNAFLKQASDAGSLPVEFHLLHYTPAPWAPRDTLLISLAMFQDLSTQFPVKLSREALGAHLSAQLMSDLYPVGSWRDRPPTQPPPDLTTPVPEVEQIPLDRSQSRLQLPQLANPGDIVALTHEFLGLRCSECRAGSNNWAVAGSRSASGAPLVSNDMHLSLSVPDVWYEATLHAPASSTTPALDVAGFTLPGVPFVIVGRNQHVAWGFTNLGADVQDVRIEHLRGAGANMQFQSSDGSWQPVGHQPEHIKVRFGHDVDFDVLTTTEHLGQSTMSTRAAGVTEMVTPIISPLLNSDHRALSLAWTIYDPTIIVSPFLSVNTAKDGAALVASFATWGGPSLNVVYADDQKHIGFHAIGAVPVRGPAVQHLRALAEPLPTGSAPADEEDQLNSDDESQSPDDAQPAASQPPPTAVPSTKPTFGYTIGSPISPVPVDALDASQIWSGYIPYAELPNIVDPANGILATANARVTPDNYPYAVALNWAAPYRV